MEGQKNNGDLVASFEDIAKTGVDHFSEIYREEIWVATAKEFKWTHSFLDLNLKREIGEIL